ncbi:hypothetical protein G6L29_08570 [Agrobacterium rhizogenes]|uniref:hypothetical protein n=1 Tax=Rhizobium rhizogenes TaxID=359 RepID=UPI00157285EF|nr:hypothetical protein [Rhizobium rhizogenes]NTI15684.1 hypothetical protein [Rhizobium rhizogenes]
MTKHQWTVTAEGMGTPFYSISASDLTDMRDGKYFWPVHLCVKVWMDIDNFFEEFERAFEYHGHDIHEGALLASWDWCQRRIKESADQSAVFDEMFPRDDFALRPYSIKDREAVRAELERRYASGELVRGTKR